MNPASRPVGITVLGILQIVRGVVSALLGLVALGGGAILTSTIASSAEETLAGGAIMLIGAVSIILGISGVILGIGMLKLKSWSWIGTLIVQGLVILMALVDLISGSGLNIISLAISGVIIFYLLKPEVKVAFRR
ncbi:MAG: hypothetical protein MUF49_20570 [Oculatellaceae cyanobacterium Prado106]|jgi:hypothetical protein|nr:hypothetical protein [Oculatellaceae cyanobacterium Prado106]